MCASRSELETKDDLPNRYPLVPVERSRGVWRNPLRRVGPLATTPLTPARAATGRFLSD